MKTYLISIVLMATSCGKQPAQPADPVLVEHIVTPRQTDASLNTYNEPHYAYVHPQKTPRNRLLVFLPGTGAEPKNYRLLVQRAASMGYHAIGLMYPNEPAVNQLCAASGDVTSHSRARLEIIDGTDRHPGVQVNAANSIIQRLAKLIGYLHQQYPSEQWGQYLSGAMPVWERITVSGHSQGAGHAGVIGKHYPVQRVIMFSGMDFLTNGQIPDWVNNTTGKEKYFALHHEQDELLDITMVKKGWQFLGMGTPVDAAGPFNQVNTITTTLPPGAGFAGRYHNATVVDVFLPKNGGLDAAWNYLLQ